MEGINLKKKKIIIFHASAGAGHKKAAESIEKAFNIISPSVEVSVIDALDYTPPYFRKLYAGSYLEIVKAIPELWGYIYDHSYPHVPDSLSAKLHKVITKIHANRIVDYVKKFSPDLIIFTHFIALEVLNDLKLKKVFRMPFYCVVTDFAVHSFWMHKTIDTFFVPSRGMKRVLISRSFEPESIQVTGIPVDPSFSKSFSKKKLREINNIEVKNPMVLMISGRYDMAGFLMLLKSFKNVKKRMQIIVLVGKDKELSQKMKQAARKVPLPVKILGYVPNMPDLMAAADIVITKPGGLTTSEILARCTPMAIIAPIPGQEMRNSDFLLESGVAIRIHDMETGGLKIECLLEDRKRLKLMKDNLKKISNPKACFTIAEFISQKWE